MFCSSTSSLFSNLGKPIFDLLVFNYQLYRSLGPLALTGLLANYFVTATILRKLSPPLGQLAAIEGRYEGNFRALHSRVLANAEEIAFYGGGDVEKLFMEKSFRDLKAWAEGIYQLRIQYNMLEVRFCSRDRLRTRLSDAYVRTLCSSILGVHLGI